MTQPLESTRHRGLTPLLEVRHLVKYFSRKQGLFQKPSVARFGEMRFMMRFFSVCNSMSSQRQPQNVHVACSTTLGVTFPPNLNSSA